MEDLKEDKIESGIYIRVGTDNVLLEDLQEVDRIEWLNGVEKSGLVRTANHLCNILHSLNCNEN